MCADWGIAREQFDPDSIKTVATIQREQASAQRQAAREEEEDDDDDDDEDDDDEDGDDDDEDEDNDDDDDDDSEGEEPAKEQAARTPAAKAAKGAALPEVIRFAIEEHLGPWHCPKPE